MASLVVKTRQCDACSKTSIVNLPCCEGCKSVYYCNIKCQQNHWDNGHKEECILIQVEKQSGKEKCNTCSKTGVKLRCCDRCKSVYYCSSNCQKEDWDNGHKNSCKEMKYERLMQKGKDQNEAYNFASAEKYRKRAIKAAKQTNNNEVDLSVSYNKMGITCSKQYKYDEALKYYNKSLKIRFKIYGENHPEVALVYNNIAGVYLKQGKYDEALQHHNKALPIYFK
jgi:tetratricopeptide (TPR) repeat protein